MAGNMRDEVDAVAHQGGFIYHADGGTYAWPGGHGIDVAVVRVCLSDLANHFCVPLMHDGNTLAVVFAVPGVGPMTVVAQNLEINCYNERELTPEEIEQMAFTYQQLSLFVGREANLEAVKVFVRSKFPEWAQVYFYDELMTNGVPEGTAYQGPSAKPL